MLTQEEQNIINNTYWALKMQNDAKGITTPPLTYYPATTNTAEVVDSLQNGVVPVQTPPLGMFDIPESNARITLGDGISTPLKVLIGVALIGGVILVSKQRK